MIEQELEAIRNDADRIPLLRRQLLSLRQYLRDAIGHAQLAWTRETHGVSNYGDLLHRLMVHCETTNNSLILVTFNYDTLVDEAFESAFSTRISSMADYVSNDRYKLFKVHGSINWWRLVSAVGTTDVLDSAIELQMEAEYEYASRPQPKPEHSYIPAVAVPTVTKNNFECPPSHIALLQRLMPEVDHLLVIGWRGVEQHFHQLWRAAAPSDLQHLCIVSGSDTDAKYTSEKLLHGALAVGRMETHCDSGFSGFLSDKDALTTALA